MKFLSNSCNCFEDDSFFSFVILDYMNSVLFLLSSKLQLTCCSIVENCQFDQLRKFLPIFRPQKFPATFHEKFNSDAQIWLVCSWHRKLAISFNKSILQVKYMLSNTSQINLKSFICKYFEFSMTFQIISWLCLRIWHFTNILVYAIDISEWYHQSYQMTTFKIF